MALAIDIGIYEDAAILRCEGEIVKGEEIDLLFGKIIGHYNPIVVLDLGAVSKIDAAGLGVLVLSHQTLQNTNQRLVLQNVNPHVMELLKKTNLHQILEISDLERCPDVHLYAAARQPGYLTARQH